MASMFDLAFGFEGEHLPSLQGYLPVGSLSDSSVVNKGNNTLSSVNSFDISVAMNSLVP